MTGMTEPEYGRKLCPFVDRMCKGPFCMAWVDMSDPSDTTRERMPVHLTLRFMPIHKVPAHEEQEAVKRAYARCAKEYGYTLDPVSGEYWQEATVKRGVCGVKVTGITASNE